MNKAQYQVKQQKGGRLGSCGPSGYWYPWQEQVQLGDGDRNHTVQINLYNRVLRSARNQCRQFPQRE